MGKMKRNDVPAWGHSSITVNIILISLQLTLYHLYITLCPITADIILIITG